MSARPLGSHPEPEHLDDLLDGAAPAQVREHVAGCPECNDLVGDLRRVRELLGRARSVTDDAAPSDLGELITRRLAAEGLTGSAGVSGQDDGWDAVPDFTAWAQRLAAGEPGIAPDSTLASVHPLRRRRRATVWLAAAASVAVLGVGGSYLIQRQGSSTQTSMSAAESTPAAGGATDDSAAGGSAESVQPQAGRTSSLTDSDRSHSMADLNGSAEALRSAFAAAGGADVGALSLADTDTSGCLELAGTETATVYTATWNGAEMVLMVLSAPAENGGTPTATGMVLDKSCLQHDDAARVVRRFTLG